MGLFGRRDQKGPGQPVASKTPESEVLSEKASIRNPGLDQTDPRQLLYLLLEGSGLSVLLTAPCGAEILLREVVRIAPALGRSSHWGRGFFRLDRDPETIWTAVDGPKGSALVVVCGPGSDSGFILEAVLKPFQVASLPLKMEMVNLGSTTSAVVDIVAGADVVPVWEVPEFSHLRPNSDGHMTLPLWARRAARLWERLGQELYKRQVRDVDGDDMNVLFGLIDGRIILMLGLGLASEGTGRYPALDGQGPYSLERIEETLAYVLPVPDEIDATGLSELSQRIADDFATGMAQLRQATSAPTLPPEPDGRLLWDRLEAAPEESAALRPFHWPALAPYITTERVRESVPESESTFESVNALAHQLRAKRKSGFEHTWRASGDAPISPSWLTIQSATFDPNTGRTVASGHFTHEVWDLPPAHDLGAIDGRNAFSFTEQGHPGGLLWPSATLYVGSSRSGVFLPLDSKANVVSVDLHGPTGTVASLEFLGGSTGAASLYNGTGQRRLLTVVEGIAGNEPIRFSGDGSWILITTASGKSILIEAATGRWLSLEVANAAWWPLGESSLLTIEHEDGKVVPRLFSLAANSYTRTFPQITLDMPMLKKFPYFWFPSVSPDGREILALTTAGVSDDYQSAYGAGDHLARITLEDGNGTLLHEPFLDSAQVLERDVREARWTQRPPQHSVQLHSDLAAKLDAPKTEHEHLSPARWADEAEAILVATLNKAIELTKAGQPMAHLMPEVLASLAPVAHNAAVWDKQSQWLIGLQQATSNLVPDGTVTGDHVAAWGHYGSAIAAIQTGRLDLLDPAATLSLP